MGTCKKKENPLKPWYQGLGGGFLGYNRNKKERLMYSGTGNRTPGLMAENHLS